MVNQQYLWLDGKYVPFADAKVHILTHSLQYASGIFEGLRANEAEKGTAIFRLSDHMQRFVNTAKIYHMDLGHTKSQLEAVAVELVKRNKLPSCYIRPYAFYNDEKIGIGVYGKKVSTAMAAVEFGSYFKSKDKGISCRVSSWRRMNSNILPPMAKASGNYLNSILASQDAKLAGADEAIILSTSGYVAEGPGENIFLVKGDKLITPSAESDILMGITRDTVIKIAESKGIEVEERLVHREELYTADELFFTGTAAEITHIVSVDSRPVGNGVAGPIGKYMTEAYRNIVTGKNKAFKSWLTYV